MQDYPRFLLEVSRLLRPGGLLLLIEPTLFPCPPPSRNNPSSISDPTSIFHPTNPSHPASATNSSSALRFSVSTSLSGPSSLTYIDSPSQSSTSSTPYANSAQARLATLTPPRPPPPHNPGHAHQEMPGWTALWRTLRACLTAQRIDVRVPEKLADLLATTGTFENVTVHNGTVPVGFWPTGLYLFPVVVDLRY